MKKIRISAQTKFIISGLLTILATVGIVAVASLSFMQNKADKSYAEFARMTALPMSFIPAKPLNTEANNFPEMYSKALMEKNADISFIEYKNEENKIIYSSKRDFPERSEDTILSTTTPIYVLDDNNSAGALTVGMSGESLKNAADTQKSYILLSFLTLGIIFSILLIVNILFMSNELKKIYKGVKEISKGQFGYKVESENMKPLFDAFNDMSEVLSKYEQQNIEQMALERNKLEAVLMSIINGVIVCDNFDNVVLTNTSALKMLDIDESAFIGTKIQNFTDSHNQKCFFDKIEEFKDMPLDMMEQKPVEFEIEAGKHTIKSVISPMFSKQHDYVGYIIVLTDITREAEVNKLKNTFISNVSHELRTPVTVLRTYTDTLCNNGDDFDEETKKEFLKTLDTEAKRLHTMVNDILDFSRLEAGNVVVKKEFTDLSGLLEQNINSIGVLAREKNIRIVFDGTKIPDVPINAESIDRVIRNLLSNAIKYSPEGKDITVKLDITEDGKYARFSVKDNGIGMAKEHLEKIFDRFYRIENATHTIKGTGLGLHLVKLTVEEKHGGKVSVSSEIGTGSTFTVLLPFNVDESELA